MVDVQTISVVIAAASVVIYVINSILARRRAEETRRSELDTRQTDILIRLHSAWGSEDLQRTSYTVLRLEARDFTDLEKEYGSWASGDQVYVDIFRVGWFFNGLGVLAHQKLADIALVDKLFGYMFIWIWEILKPIIETGRQVYNQPKSLEWFEYLYNEMIKHQQLTTASK